MGIIYPYKGSTRVLTAATGRTRVIRKVVPADSFFGFFKPPQPPTQDQLENDEVDEEQLEDLDARLEIDYQLGEDFKEKIIPRAVDYFTGKALRYEDDFEDEDIEEFDEDDEDEDDEDEEVGFIHLLEPFSELRAYTDASSKGCSSCRSKQPRVQTAVGIGVVRSCGRSLVSSHSIGVGWDWIASLVVGGVGREHEGSG